MRNRGPILLRTDTTIKPALITPHGVLYETDCLNLFAALRAESMDCVFADPPFNLGKTYGNGQVNDDRKKLDYLDWCFTWLDQAVRVVAPGGAIFVYILPQWVSIWRYT